MIGCKGSGTSSIPHGFLGEKKEGKPTSTILPNHPGYCPFPMPTIELPHECIEPFIEHQGEQRGFWLRKPRVIGETILIARQGKPVPDSHENRKLIFLDVQRAFGTGGHGTTEGCLLALEKYLRGGETVLDVGTGTGILAIAAYKLGAGHITAVDIDRTACLEARKNLAVNEIENGIDVREGGIQTAEGQFDIIAANLRTPVLIKLMDELISKLVSRGIAIFSGILERELPAFLSFLEPYPLETLDIKRILGWMTLVVRKGVRSGPPAAYPSAQHPPNQPVRGVSFPTFSSLTSRAQTPP